MTEQLNIAELRAAWHRVSRPTRDYRPTDDLDHRALHNAIPSLLAALEEARAERDKLAARCRVFAADFLGASGDRDAAESLAWDALGRPEGTRDTSNVHRLCEAYAATKAKLAALVGSLEHIKDIMGGHDGCQGWSSPEDVWGIADNALAAAKEQP